MPIPENAKWNAPFTEEVAQYVSAIILDSEFDTAQSNAKIDIADYEAAVDMLECKRTEKDYDWMSDVFLPELPAIILTDAGGWAAQYFQTRDFIEVKLEEGVADGLNRCKAVKRIINKTLNQRDIYHYHKYIRGRLINALAGQVYAVCWWEQHIESRKARDEVRKIALDVDTAGNPLTDTNAQEQAFRQETVPVYEDVVVRDRFNYDIVDPANVYVSNEYAYNIQQKAWVILRSELDWQDLVDAQETCAYFNLDVLRKIDEAESGTTESATAADTYNKVDKKQTPTKTPYKKWDILERYGRFPCVIDEDDPDARDQKDGYPKKATPGYDAEGKVVAKASAVECVITYAVRGNHKICIRFQPQQYRDPYGNPFRPILRGLCYIHPRVDRGLSDGQYGRESQAAINDVFNLAMDRVKLATLPTFKGRKYGNDDNDTIYWEPEHVIELDDPEKDLIPMDIRDNPRGALDTIGMLRGGLQQLTSVFPSTMGALPNREQTATATAGSDARSSLRANFKSYTYEFSFLIDFYTMILWMTHQYARPETLKKLLGDMEQFFDPNGDYSYAPVSSNIETDQSKSKKLQLIDNYIGRVANVQNPNTPKLLNYLLKMAFNLFGSEFPDYEKYLLDETAPATPAGSEPANANAPPTSGSAGIEQSVSEQVMRNNAGGMPG